MENNKKISPVTILGFYFLIFQSYPGKYIKCWLDGEESYTLYYPNEIIEICRKANISGSIISALQEAFSETSFFMWDVEGEKIKRLSCKFEPSNIGEEIKNLQYGKPKPLSETAQIGWGSSIMTNDGNISLKF